MASWTLRSAKSRHVWERPVAYAVRARVGQGDEAVKRRATMLVNEYKWDPTAARRVWSLGLPPSKANMLVDTTPVHRLAMAPPALTPTTLFTTRKHVVFLPATGNLDATRQTTAAAAGVVIPASAHNHIRITILIHIAGATDRIP